MYFSLSVESQAFGFLNKILNIGYIVTRNTVSINFHPSRVKKNEDLLKMQTRYGKIGNYLRKCGPGP